MSSQDQDHVNISEGNSAKRRRIGRACDPCRLKKSDGRQGPGQKCWRCAIYGDECTFVREAPKRPVAKKPRGYVQRLESRIAAMEALFARLCPTADLSYEMGALDTTDIYIEYSDSSESSAEDEGQKDVTPPLAQGRVKKEGDSNQFTYAVPPAFSPSVAQSNGPIQSSSRANSLPRPDPGTQLSIHYDALPRAGHETLDICEDTLESSDEEIDDTQSLLRGPYIWRFKRYFGTSGSMALVKQVVEMKHAFLLNSASLELAARDRVRWLASNADTSNLSFLDNSKKSRAIISMCQCAHGQQCQEHPWVYPDFHPPPPVLTFPEPDLLAGLAELYFNHFNVWLPVLNRPLFYAAIADGLHVSNPEFGNIVLLVCALGSRFSNDKRVLLEKDPEKDMEETSNGHDNSPRNANLDGSTHGESDGHEDNLWGWHSAGWKWFKQVAVCSRMFTVPATLYDLQIICLAALYYHGLSRPEVSRRITGLGLRLALDMGAHRKKTYCDISRDEAELTKRTFWSLLWLDWTHSAHYGRTCVVQYEDLDVGYPIECDDDYWITEDPALAFQQPPGKPSFMSYFICSLKLNQINAFALRTIYSTNKSRSLLGFMGTQWEQRTVSDLDSALNSWLDTVPSFLRWDPQKSNSLFFRQSACLAVHYHALQLAIHRPFIPSPGKPSPTPFPSLAICTSAARSCVHIMDTVYKRMGPTDALQMCTMPLFMSGIVLMLSMWGSGSPITLDTMKELEDTHKAMTMLKEMAPRFHFAGRFWDMLYGLAVVGELPLPLHLMPQDSQPQDRATSTASAEEGSFSADGISVSQASMSLPPKLQNSTTMTSTATMQPSLEPICSNKTELLPHRVLYDPDLSARDYDMSPSVFSPLSTVPATPSRPIASNNSLENSMFSGVRSHRSTSLPHLDAPIPTLLQDTPVAPPAFAAPSRAQSLQTPSFDVGPTSSIPFSLPVNSPQPFQGDQSDTLAMWSNAPTGFEWDDWSAYISGLPENSATGTVFSQIAQDNLHPDTTIGRAFTFYDSPL